jgi:hypothetical protein
VKHAGPEALAALGELLAEIRREEGVVERRPGIFYRKGRALLHFHEDPSGLHADLRRNATFERFRVESAAERRAFLAMLRQALRRA